MTTTRTSGSGDATVSLSGSGTSYTATVTSPTTAKGTITLWKLQKMLLPMAHARVLQAKPHPMRLVLIRQLQRSAFTEPAGTQYGATFDVPITISKSVTGFIASDITVTTTRTSGSGDATVTLSGSGKDYTATVTSPTTAKGTITLEVAKNAVTDGTRTGPANKATSSAIAFSTMNPTVTFTEPAGTQYGNTFNVPITINKSVTGFAASDITVTSSTGTASVSLSGSGSSYTATVTSPTTAKGTITLSVAKDAVTDGTRTGPATKATSNAISFDTTVATVSFTEPNGTQYGNTFNVPITINKSVTGFAASDITVTSSSGTASVSLSGSGTSYTATVTSPTAGKGTITLAVAADSVTDGTRTGPATKATSDAIAFDTTVARVSFTEPVGTQLGSGFAVPITFSKNITGFDASDIKVTSSSGTASVTLIRSGLSLDYSAWVTSPTNTKGLIVLQVAANSVTDGTRAGPANIAASNPISFDTTQGTVSFTEPKGVQVANTFDVGITFSKSVTEFEAGDITITTTHNSGSGNGTVTLSGSGKSYTATVTSPTAAEGTVTLAVGKYSAYDGANDVPATTATSQAIAYDTTTPTVSFTAPQAVSNVDTFDIGITFSKDVTGFEASDITLTTTHTEGSGDATFTLSGSDRDYTAAIAVPSDAAGTITLKVAANAATDSHRTGPETAQSTNAISFSTITPVISDPVNTPPANTDPATIVFSEPSGTQVSNTFDVGITFSKSVTGFEASDITLTTTRTTGTGDASVALNGSGTAYTATITSPTDAKGSVTLAIAANAANDGANDVPTTVQSSAAIAFDTTVPEVNLTVPQGVQSSAFDVSITFSKPVTGFEASDITLTTTHTEGSGDATFTLSGSDIDYTATIAVPSNAAGTITLAVAANAATDGHRTGPATTQSTNAISFDTITPVNSNPINTPPVNSDPNDTPPVNSDPNNTLLVNTDPNSPDGTSTDTGSPGSDNSHIDRIIFNEIYNATSDKNDWIELRNAGDHNVNLEGWEIGIVTGNGETLKEKKIVTLPYYELIPNETLLIVNTAPNETDLALGINIGNGRWDENHLESWNTARYLIAKKLKLPVKEKYLLTLRYKTDRIGTLEAVVDIAGTYWPNNLEYEGTLLWPLQIIKPKGLVPALEPDAAWRRIYNVSEPRGYIAAAWTASGYQEGRGYDKDAPKETSLGTPGLPNHYPFPTNLPSGPVAISEIMFATRNSRRAAPQWIEFYNTSAKTVDLRGWQLNLEMRSETNTLKNKMLSFTFEGVHVGPKQTLLVVTQKGSNSGHFPEHKIYDLSVQQKDIPGLSELLNANQYLLSSAGFSLMLSDANGKVIDKIGNLDGDRYTMDEPAWTLPSVQTANGHRSSLLRRYKAGEPLPGTEPSSWQVAKDMQLSFRTYWGHSTDIGNPGYRRGGYLPVSLSQFNAVFTGTEVVLKWTTESELDNAGFNIYRSESPTGEFVQVNAELIQGAGTTGERQQYEWKDTTTKPNISYYYRIEDVSFSGVREQLQTVRMRGQVSASGKALRTWASLKSHK